MLKGYGSYIVTFSRFCSHSPQPFLVYYGDRATTYLFGQKYVLIYRLVYVSAFFIASFTDTTIIWSLSYVAIVLMAVPNLIGILLLRKEVKESVRDYWLAFSRQYPGEKISKKMSKRFCSD
jgi:AGCS family alanine or glycine:cation symporter